MDVPMVANSMGSMIQFHTCRPGHRQLHNQLDGQTTTPTTVSCHNLLTAAALKCSRRQTSINHGHHNPTCMHHTKSQPGDCRAGKQHAPRFTLAMTRSTAAEKFWEGPWLSLAGWPCSQV